MRHKNIDFPNGLPVCRFAGLPQTENHPIVFLTYS